MDSTSFPAGRKDGGKLKTNKPLRLWRLDAFWNRVKPSKKKGLNPASEDFEADISVPKFDLATIAAATNEFSQKIGEGGYGSVYKPVSIIKTSLNLLDIALMKEGCLYSSSWKMEALNLDIFMFDEERRHQLQWPVRSKIIIGIAKGIIYLHQDSGLRIIHSDINPKNILLDINMNPKISGTCLAKTWLEDQSETYTTRLAGTYGYMSPEYVIEGRVSDKVDVYSFGVLVLEVLCGKRNTGYLRYDSKNLIESAWELWDAGTPWNFVDEFLRVEFPHDEILRCSQVGLLCIQPDPNHRPTMASVLAMLLGEDTALHEKMEDCRGRSGRFQKHQTEGTAIFVSDDSAATFEYDDTLQR